MELSVIITAKQEPETVGALIIALENDLEISFGNLEIENCEILLVCPDQQTKKAGLESDRLGLVSWLKDKGEGKPAALNQAFDQAKGKYLVLTDGDVVWQKGALKELLVRLGCLSDQSRDNPRIVPTKNTPTKNVGLVSGHPVPINEKDNLFGFWAHFLTFAADQQRRVKQREDKYFDASGYLLAINRKLVEPMPKDVLVDDAYLSYLVWSKKRQIKYAPKAKIKVKFPTNFTDWVKQKRRTLSGYVQLQQIGIIDSNNETRSFREEIKGVKLIFSYPKKIRQYWWVILLLFARLYIWLLVFVDRLVLKKEYSGNWERIESTKMTSDN